MGGRWYNARMTVLDPLLHSPRLPQFVQELESILDAERAARVRFFDDVREDQKAEFINGEVIVHSPARFEHVATSDNLLQLLKTHVTKHNLGFVGHEKLLISLTRNDYEPDISFFVPAKAAKFTPDQMKFPAPDLVVEILSPSTQSMDRGVKWEDYAAHDVNEYWIVDPGEQTIEQYLLEGGTYKLAVKIQDGIIKSRAIRGLELPVRAAFDAKLHLEALAGIING